MKESHVRVRAVVTGVCLIFSPTVLMASDTSLCNSDEKVYFSCSLHNKTVSLCATPDLSPASGVLTYRIGAPGKQPELIYPTSRINPADAFSFGYYTYAKGGAEQIQFKINSYVYTLYSEHHVFRDNGSGVVVEKSGKIISHLRCDESTIRNDLYHLKDIGMPVLQMLEIEGFPNY